MKVAIYVQHLLGSGHLVRMQMLAEALHDHGVNVTLITGGRPGVAVPENKGYPVIQLPAIQTQPGDFTTLLDLDNNPVDDVFRDRRRRKLIDVVIGLEPDILVVETWPFGRRQMELELIPLLDRLREREKPPAIVSSIRDVLQVRAPKRRMQTLDNLERYISMVLVHGDPDFIELGRSFVEADRIAVPVHYTGYIAKTGSRKPVIKNVTNGEILVSAGGGAAGRPLLETALAAARNDHRKWRILAGNTPRAEWFAGANGEPGTRITVEPNREDFFELLRRCTVSVSQFGYNTALELLTAQCKAVVVPYAGQGETEQSMRAERFARSGLCEVVPEDGLTPRALLGAIDRISSRSGLAIARPAMDGARRAVEILNECLR